MEHNTKQEVDTWEDEEERFRDTCNSYVAALVSYVALNKVEDDMQKGGRTTGSKNVKRERVPVERIFANLGERLFKKCYRMPETLFWKLERYLQPYLRKRVKRKRGATPNGDIPISSRLSMALRWFAGGEPADILQVHGVHYNEVHTSGWEIVDAINLCPELQLGFPTDHEEQRKIAAGFQALSSVDFQGCVGNIDGMLVWTNKPSKASLEHVVVGPKKFFCGSSTRC